MSALWMQPVYDNPTPLSYVIQSMLWLISCYLTCTAGVIQWWTEGREADYRSERKRGRTRGIRIRRRRKRRLPHSVQQEQSSRLQNKHQRINALILCNSCLVDITFHKALQPRIFHLHQSFSVYLPSSYSEPSIVNVFLLLCLPDIPPPTTITS